MTEGVREGRPIGWRWALVAAIGMLVFAALPALAVHDTGAFELDGDAADNLAVGDDWANVCHEADPTACPTGTDTSAEAVSWTSDNLLNGTPSLNATLFTGGGSKDGIDIPSWRWKDGAGGLPDKDNLLHSFAARYSLPVDTDGTDGTLCEVPGAEETCEVLFFGSDRFDNSGDAQQGFWFFQNEITLTDVKSGGGFKFDGVHETGDLLIISNFSNGGNVSTISVYTWDPTVTGNLKLEATSDAANCGSADDGDGFCGIVNPTTITMPWAFVDKSNTPTNQALNGEFYEGGVNLTALGLGDECFASVASETRSSTSTTAVLKDFVLDQFAPCEPTMTTQASATVASPVTPGTPVTDEAEIQIIGASNPDDPVGDVTFFLCGPIATGDCATGGTNIGTGTLVGGADTTDGFAEATSPQVNTAASPLAPGRYCFRAEWPGDDNYDGIAHTNSTTECFAVKDVSQITTAQNWRPNDTATVTTTGGTAVSGSVTFTLYPGGSCTGTPLGDWTDASEPFASSNGAAGEDSVVISATGETTVSWRAVFTPSDPDAVQGSTAVCEVSVLDIDNDGP